MKKFIIPILCCLLLITGCNQSTKQTNSTANTNQTTSTEKTSYSVKDFFPMEPDTKLDYKGTGNEYASMTIFKDYIKEKKLQQRVINDGTISSIILELKDDSIAQIGTFEEVYYKQNLTNNTVAKSEILIKEPIQKGNTWSLSDGGKRYISSIDTSISTTAGDFKCIEVVTEYKNSKITSYYSPKIGLIKEIFESEGSKVETVLEKITHNTKYSQDLKVFYPDVVNNRIIYVNKSISLSTNEDVTKSIENLFKKSPAKDIDPILNKNTKINKTYIDINKHIAYIDLSKNFLTDMNAGSGVENDILQSIVNTIGNYYNVSSVVLTVDNKPYLSGHFEMSEGETFDVDIKNSVELKK